MLSGSLSSSAFTFSSSYLSPAYLPGPSRSIPSTSVAACFTLTSSDFLSASAWSAFFPESREHPLLKTRQRINIHENDRFTVLPPIYCNPPYEFKSLSSNILSVNPFRSIELYKLFQKHDLPM